MYFYVNNHKWELMLVSAHNGILRRSDGIYTLGVTDNQIKAVFVARGLSDAMLDKVICHELCHVYAFEYDLNMDIETEEIVADFLASYGRRIIYTADNVIDSVIEKLA